MTWYEIPLQAYPQTFSIALAGVNYQLTVKYCDALEGGWVFDLGNADTGESLIAGAPIICGANCLAGLGYLDIGGMFIAYTNGNEFAPPTFENLGTESKLYFVVTD